MHDHHTNTAVDAQALTARLKRLSKSNSLPNDGSPISRLPRMSRSGTTSSSASSSYHLPIFRKSQTSSTTESNEVSRLEIVRTIPISKTNRETVEVGQGEFSKPRIGRRRESEESARNQKEFRYYGRHANSWLFNDFSVTESIRKGWGKTFAKHDDEGKDA